MDAGAGGPAPHFHRTFSESFYILSGTVSLYDGREWTQAASGDFLQVPEGGIHAFNNESSDEPAVMLILFSPAPPREQYFTEVAEINDAGRELSPEEWAAFLAKHDQYSA
jgi:quercetin dioxygenase-like cupin family protein